MVSIIHSPSGITLFSRIFEKFCEKISEEMGAALIGSFISAIKTLSQEFGQDEIKQIEMSTLKFLIYEKNQIMIFFLLDNTDGIEDYKKILIVCLNAFFKMFSKDIYEKYNNTFIFQEFNPILHEIFKIPPEKIEPSCLNCLMGQKKNCLFKQVQQKILEFKEIPIRISKLERL